MNHCLAGKAFRVRMAIALPGQNRIRPKKAGLVERTLHAMKTCIRPGRAMENDSFLHFLRHMQPERHGERLPAVQNTQTAEKIAASSPVKRSALPTLPGTSTFAIEVDPGFLGDTRFSRRLPASSRSSG